MRYIYQNVVQDGRGNAVEGAVITVYLAGTTTKATIYTAVSGGSADADSAIASESDGTFSFYIDDSDYSPAQRFKYTVSVSGYGPETWDYISIIPMPPGVYYIDPTATDQGAATTTGDRTIKDLVDSIGSTNKGILVFTNVDRDAQTNYVLSTSETITANIYLRFEPGAIIIPDASISLTVYSPGHITANQDQQIFDVSNNYTNPVLFTDGGTVYPEWWGAYNDGTNGDVTADALQSCLTSLASVSYGAKIELNGSYLIDTQLSIAFHGLTISGTGDYYNRIICDDCSAILINQTSNVTLSNFEIAQSTRYTSTPNAYIGIDIAGVTGTRPFNIILRDIYIDGFATAIEANWCWSSVFDNVSSAYGHVGILILGESVNNSISNCSFILDDGATGAMGISFNDTNNSAESCMINNTLIYGAEYGVYGLSASHVLIQNCIIDYNYKYGIYISDGTSGPSIDWIINGNYFAMNGTATSGVTIDRGTASTQQIGHKITNNKFIVYSGQSCTQGVETLGDEAKNIIISGNGFIGFATYDIILSSDSDNSCIITDNQCLSTGPTYNIYLGAGGLVANNIGVVYYTQFTTFTMVGKLKHVYGEAAPSSGTWGRGDICWNTVADASGNVGWVCITAGTSGTWKSFGTIAS